MEVYQSGRTAAELEYALGAVPSIGENGNWFIGEQDTGIFAKGINVTGAEVGQTVKITAVDENGVPTAWEPAEIVGGDKWRLVSKITITEDVASISITQDDSGNAFSLKKVLLVGSVVGATNATSGWLFVTSKSNRAKAEYRIGCSPGGAPGAGGTKKIEFFADICGQYLRQGITSAADWTSENPWYAFAHYDNSDTWNKYISYDAFSDIAISTSNGYGFAANTVIELWGVDTE